MMVGEVNVVSGLARGETDPPPCSKAGHRHVARRWAGGWVCPYDVAPFGYLPNDGSTIFYPR